MAFGMTFPISYSPLFNGLELFTQPRYVRRSYVHPRAPVHHRHRGGFGHRARCGPFEADLFELLTNGNDFFLDRQDEDLIEHPYAEHGTYTTSTTPKKSKVAVAQPSVVEPSNPTAVSAPTTTKIAVATATAKKMGEVTTKKTENGVKFEIAFPGLTLADLKLDLDTKKKALIVKADKSFEEKHEDEYGTRTSYKKISFHRALPLETLPSASDIHADFADGSLHINVTNKAIEAVPEVTPLTIGSQTAVPVIDTTTTTTTTTTTAADTPEAAPSAAPSSSMEVEATVEDAEE